MSTQAMNATRIFRSYARPINKSLPKQAPSPRAGMTTEKFLKTIGRECEKYTDKFESWDVLFTATSSDMRHKLSIPTHQRKWILDWTEKYRQGIDPYYIRPSRKKKN